MTKAQEFLSNSLGSDTQNDKGNFCLNQNEFADFVTVKMTISTKRIVEDFTALSETSFLAVQILSGHMLSTRLAVEISPSRPGFIKTAFQLRLTKAAKSAKMSTFGSLSSDDICLSKLSNAWLVPRLRILLFGPRGLCVSLAAPRPPFPSTDV